MRGASGEPSVGRFLLCVCRLRSTHSKLCAAKLLKKMKSRPSEGADFALGQTEIPFVGHALGRGYSLCGCRWLALARGCSLCGSRWRALGLRKKIKRSCVLLFTAYPEPGSNRHGLPHWCLRPARLPIPPSGPLPTPLIGESGAKVGYFLMYANYFPPFLAEGSEIRIKLYGICFKKQNVLCWGMKD